MKREWQHDCDKCRQLGQTIGGQRIYDLYVCGDSVIARYGNEGGEYLSCPILLAHPRGHAELWAARSILLEQEVKARHAAWLAAPDGPQAA